MAIDNVLPNRVEADSAVEARVLSTRVYLRPDFAMRITPACHKQVLGCCPSNVGKRTATLTLVLLGNKIACGIRKKCQHVFLLTRVTTAVFAGAVGGITPRTVAGVPGVPGYALLTGGEAAARVWVLVSVRVARPSDAAGVRAERVANVGAAVGGAPLGTTRQIPDGKRDGD